MKKLVIVFAAIALLILAVVVGCVCCSNNDNETRIEIPNVTMRLYYADENAMDFEFMYIDSSELIDKMMEVNGIRIDGFWFDEYFDGSKIYVNLNKEAERTSLQGSTGASITAQILINTFSSIPNVNLIEILIDGESDRYGDHFDFSQLFISI